MSDRIYDITDFGALSNNQLQTAKIQAAIDKCYADGGGIVVIPEGRFLTGGVRLRSYVTLYLKSNAQLVGSRNPMDYYGFLNDTIEPVNENDKTDVLWKSTSERTTHDHINKCASSWNNAIIRAIDAENIAIVGEEGSYIDGCDCFDETGEEHYRGPHAINFHRCNNIRFEGYTVVNSANWAHAIFDSKNILMKNVSVKAGHDGIHITSCSNVHIENSEFYTGDDCVAGIDNLNVTVRDCMLNTACSGMRFGGTNVYVTGCKFFGPAKYLFRGSLTDEEKRNGTVAEGEHRFNMLSAYTYYSDFSRSIDNVPGNIEIKNCTISNTDRFLHYNFSGNEPWQCNRPLKDITFSNVKATGIKMPLTAYGSDECKIELKIRDSQIEFDNLAGDISFIHTYGYEKISLNNVELKNVKGSPLIKSWGNDGEVITDGLNCDNENVELIEKAKEDFICHAI